MRALSGAAAGTSGRTPPHMTVHMPHSLHQPARAVRCVQARSQFYQELKTWQKRKLEEAYDVGKRKVSIKQLAGDTQLSRDQVMEFMRWWGDLPAETRASFQETRAAAEAAAEARREHLQQQRAAKNAAAAAERTHHQHMREMKREARKWSMTKAQEATLEMIYQKGNKYPGDRLVGDICELEKLSKKRVLDWFAARRRRGIDGGAAG